MGHFSFYKTTRGFPNISDNSQYASPEISFNFFMLIIMKYHPLHYINISKSPHYHGHFYVAMSLWISSIHMTYSCYHNSSNKVTVFQHMQHLVIYQLFYKKLYPVHAIILALLVINFITVMNNLMFYHLKTRRHKLYYLIC